MSTAGWMQVIREEANRNRGERREAIESFDPKELPSVAREHLLGAIGMLPARLRDRRRMQVFKQRTPESDETGTQGNAGQ